MSQIPGNPFLSRIWEVLEPSLRTPRAGADPLSDRDWQALADEHGRLVSLLRERDGEAAADAFAAHAAGLPLEPDSGAQKKKPARGSTARKK
ncbi:FCD domain-containing protein [Amycolatopsis benzoatilytica]|uniref:FCD domain-containing protein n=1 Tax=Amycolatopsis benzoatilytica TaxID=346045 RepID=UPI0003A78CC5|nr:FCD domain-containing protein [Amycolatopsis benzoatilytica]